MEGIDGLPGARVEGNGWTLLRDREDLILYPVEKKEKGSWTIPSAEDPGDSPLSLSVEKGKEIEGTAYEACMDPDKLQFPLELRSIREKDRFRPLGMRRGSKTVREHLTDRKWPLHEKERALVLADAEGRILWVVGSTIDDRCKVGEGSKKLLRVHYTGS